MPRRKMSWLLIVWSAAMAAWAIGAGVSANCADQTGRFANAAQAGCEAGTGIGIGIIILLWFIGFVVLALIWFMTRPRRRECPVCGRDVKRGTTVCSSCGYDFAASSAVQTSVAQSGSEARL